MRLQFRVNYAWMLEADDNKRYWCWPKCSTEMQWKDWLFAILIFWNTDQRKQHNDSGDGISLPAFVSNLEWANKGRVSLPVGSFSERLQSALQLNYRFKKCESAWVSLNSWNIYDLPSLSQEVKPKGMPRDLFVEDRNWGKPIKHLARN